MAFVSASTPYGVLVTEALNFGCALVSLKEYYDWGMAKKQADQIIKEIVYYGGRMKVKFYKCKWVSSNGNSESGFFPKYEISLVN